MERRMQSLRLLAAFGLLLSIAAFGSARAGGPAPTITPVATGLDNPRGLAFGPDGALYVAEAGRGGASTSCRTSAEGRQECYGATGAITRITFGTATAQRRVAEGLPSLAGQGGPQPGGAATGPHDVSVLSNGDVYATIGLGGPPLTRTVQLAPVGADFAQLITLAANWFVPANLVDIGAFEQASDPDEQGPDSNPYGLIALRDWRVVVDAGGNSLLAALPDTVLTLTTFPNRTIPAAPGGVDAAPAGATATFQSVPTSVAIGPDGAFYVGELTGFPYPVGAANVYRVVPGQAPTVYATGFTNIVDVAFDDAGNLYVLELFDQGLGQAFGPGGNLNGELLRVAPPATPGGPVTTTSIASNGLVAPGGLALSPTGGIYVSNLSIAAGGGQVVRIDTCGGATGCTEPKAAPAPLSALGRGENEVNTQGTPGQGDPDGLGPALFTLDADLGQVCVQSLVTDIAQPSMAHIHRGPAGVNGPVVVNFTPFINGSTISGCAQGVSAALIAEIQADPSAFYYNVHNAAFPAGAVRDQLAVATTGVSEQVLPVISK